MTAAPALQSSRVLQPVIALWGVGPERAAQLARLNIRTVEDLLLHRPRRYEDRRHFRPIAELQLHEPAITRGTVVASGVKLFQRGRKSVFVLILDDGTARLHCRWWNLPYMEKYFSAGDEVVVFGKPVALKPRTIDHPETEVVDRGEENFIHLNRITPIYPLTEGLPQRWLRSLIWRTLQQFAPSVADPPATKHLASETFWTRLPESCRPARRPPWPSRAEAIRRLHFPEKTADIEMARQRLALDEFAALQEQIRLRRRHFEARAQSLPCGGDNHLIRPFLAGLSFKLTAAQTRVLREIRADLRGPHPMRRLLQGDVGAGKTLVAACAALMALESGYNVALMAPTEVLAEQHFGTFNRWFGPLGIEVRLHTGARHALAGPERAGKRPLLVVGTHALVSEGLELPRLGLAIIDEQHKFGVAQRERLVRKGRYPHLLVMTATPIPRTLGLTVYGDLDISVLDELPPGRGRVRTVVRTTEVLPKVWAFLREKLRDGRQVYVVYPRVAEDSDREVKAVTKEHAQLVKIFAPYAVELLHGRLPAREKEEAMARFRANAAQVLLATSLIEVGLDVPNATVMLVENAEQFGLAQLHQLRGRIGRGAHDSFCILLTGATNVEARERLRTLEQTTDGFRIAEADLKRRGPGDLLGREQSGVPDFRFGDLAEDGELVRLARCLVAAP